MALFPVAMQYAYTNSTNTTGFGISPKQFRNRSRVCPLPRGIAAKPKAVSLHTRPAVKGVFQRKQHVVVSSQSFEASTEFGAAVDQSVQSAGINPVFMVVSDLDGTMVGDDAATLRFKDYWQREAGARGCWLVYSTGRTLEQYYELAEEKGDVLMKPDLLISAVGTRVYKYSTIGVLEEDTSWTDVLSEGWDEGLVLAACTGAIALCGADKMHFRPAREMNSHKITAGVHVEKVQAAEDHITAALKERSVRAKLIVSGSGDWRYLDVVPMMAGKLQSLEHVRQETGIPKDKTVGCGDSGNDIAMFEGENLSIVVGNAQEDLVKWLDANVPNYTGNGGNNGQPPRIIKTTKHMADGILEGLQFFGLY